MKRILKVSALICSLLMLTVSFAACGQPHEPEQTGGNEREEEITKEPEQGRETEPLTLSHESGAYAGAFSLEVSGAEGAKIYYTTDCSEPTTSSLLYTSPIAITDNSQTRSYSLTSRVTYGNPSDYGYYSYGKNNECTVIKLLETDAEGNEVARKTATYFIRSGGESYFTVPVISISMPEEDAVTFYNDIENESKERAWMEYFDFASGERFSLNTQIKIGGNWTKGFPYRTMNLNFNKDENGKKNTPVTVDIFEGREARDGGELTDFKRFRLHSGGNAQVTSWFSDAFTQKVAAEVRTSAGDYLNVATTGYRPCEVYLNGEYWGLYAIREHYSDVYFEQNYGVDKDDVILLDRNYNISSNPQEYADSTVYNTAYSFEVAEDDANGQGMTLATEFFDFLYSADFSLSSNYERLAEMMDMQSLIDMVLVHLYAGNWDFMSNNVKMWRTANIDPSNPYADGKWRFCLHDLDFAFEQQWGDNGIEGANGYLLYDNNDIYSFGYVPTSYYDLPMSQGIIYRPGKNYLDFYLGNAYLGYGAVPAGRLNKGLSCLLSAPMQNAQFQTQFIAGSAAVKEIYTSAQAKQILTDMTQQIAVPMQRQQTRWIRSGYTYSVWLDWTSNISEVLSVRNYMKDYLNYYDGGLMYQNGDYFDRQIEAAIFRFNQ